MCVVFPVGYCAELPLGQGHVSGEGLLPRVWSPELLAVFLSEMLSCVLTQASLIPVAPPSCLHPEVCL